MRKNIYCLTKNEIKVYEAGLQIGGATILELARKARVNRATTYNVAESLVQKGLLTIALKGKKRFFYPAPPDKALDLAKKKINQATQDFVSLEETMPQWEDLYYAAKIRPKVRYYEGLRGIKQVYEDTLDQEKGSEILAYASIESLNEYLPKYTDKYIRRRARKRIAARGFAPDTKLAHQHYQKYKDFLLKVKFIQPSVKFATEVNLYNNKVALMSYGKELIGTIIESREFYNTQKAIFDLLWQNIP